MKIKVSDKIFQKLRFKFCSHAKYEGVIDREKESQKKLHVALS